MTVERFVHSEVTEKIIGSAYEVYNELGYGFLESVYQKSLALVLEEHGLRVAVESEINIYFRGQSVGHFFADLFVEEKIIVE